MKYCNIQLHIASAYYSLDKDFNDLPDVLRLVVEGTETKWTQEITLPLKSLSLKSINENCPLFYITSRKKEAENELKMLIEEEIQKGNFTKGIMLDHTGYLTFPDGQMRFLRGSQLYPDDYTYPYIVPPQLQNIILKGNGQTSPDQIIRTLLKTPKSALLVLAYVALTSVRSCVLKEVGLQAVLYITGTQGLGKTTLATRVAGIYKNTENEKDIGVYQAGSSFAAIEDAMVNFYDQPVIIDDLCLSVGKETERKSRELAAQVIRVGSGTIPIVKKRGRASIENFCNAGIILTAEFTLENASDLERCILVPIKKQLELPNSLTPELTGDLIRIFSLWFARKGGAEIQRLKEDLNPNLLEPEFENFPLRVATNYVCLKWAFESLLKSIQTESNSHDAEKIREKFYDKLSSALGEHQKRSNKLNENVKEGNLAYVIWDIYKRSEESEENGRERLKMTSKIKEFRKYEAILWKGDLCMTPDKLVRFVRLQPGYHEWTQRRIVRKLKDYGALVTQEEGADTVHIQKGTPRCYRIDLKILKKKKREGKENAD